MWRRSRPTKAHELLWGCCLANAQALEWYMAVRVRRASSRPKRRPRALLACGNCRVSRFDVVPVGDWDRLQFIDSNDCCEQAMHALRAFPGLVVEPVDGRDGLPHQALLTCGWCLLGAFWVQPPLPSPAASNVDKALSVPRRQPRLTPLRWWER